LYHLQTAQDPLSRLVHSVTISIEKFDTKDRTENKPICDRCRSDNRICNYGIQLQWEDDSRKRGIKHGRTTRADRVGLSAARTATWLGFPRGQGGRYFLNTFASDIDGKIVVPVMQGLDFGRGNTWKREAMLHTTPTRMPTLNFAALSNGSQNLDGILFDYCNLFFTHYQVSEQVLI
jgi:hypothetical protein